MYGKYCPSGCKGPLFSRRQLLQIGGLAPLGLTLEGLWRAQAAQAARTSANPGTKSPIRSCILIFYYGGPSHLDTFDPKPGAPAEIRGQFRAIQTSVPGLCISEHLPRLARSIHHLAIIRSMHHHMRAHDSACAETLTGRTPVDGDREFLTEGMTTYPSYGAILSYLRREQGLVVPHAALPFVMRNVPQAPGQTPGFLGSAYAPLRIQADPDTLTYQSILPLVEGNTRERLQEREVLLQEIEGAAAHPTTSPGMASMGTFFDRAFRLLQSGTVRQALDIEMEDPRTRQRYGHGPARQSYQDGPTGQTGAELAFARNMRGQGLLLARRLVEAGVPFINVYDYKQQGKNWDTHARGFTQLKEELLPPTDQALSALVEDLDARGLLDSTLVVALGEFGRTPKVTANGGRDHWPDCYFALLAGGGVQGGAVYGASDNIGAYPNAKPVTPGDLAATIFWRFGIDPETELHDSLRRPHRVAEGTPLRELFG